MNIKILFLFIALLTSCATAQNNKSEKVENELKSLVNQLVDAQFMKHDGVKLDEILSADFMEVMPSGTVNSREQSVNAQKDANSPMRKVNAQAAVDEFQIRVFDELAIVVAKLNINYFFNGQSPISSSARITIVCRREKSIWKIASSQFTRIMSPDEMLPKPPPPPPAIPKKQ